MTYGDVDASREVAACIEARTGLRFPGIHDMHAERTLREAAARFGGGDLMALRDRIATDGDVFDAVVSDLTIGETYLFREPECFAFLADHVVPEVVARHGPEHTLRAWSAACSTGEEAYSLAMTLAEARPGVPHHVLATDINRRSIEAARRGAYRPWSMRGGALGLAARHVHEADDTFVVADDVRDRVTFRYLNLVEDEYPSLASGIWELDVIFCRNVLLYFNAHAAALVLQRLHDSLAEGGWLVLGPSDPDAAACGSFEVHVIDGLVVYRKPVAPNLPGPPPVQARRRPKPVSSATLHTLRPEPIGREPAAPATVPDVVARREPGPEVLDGIRRLANTDVGLAVARCAELGEADRLWPELHFLHGVLLWQLNRNVEAAASLRRALYVNDSLAVVHYTLGAILSRLGDVRGATSAYRDAATLAAALPPDELLALGEGERAGALAHAATVDLAALKHSRSRS